MSHLADRAVGSSVAFSGLSVARCTALPCRALQASYSFSSDG